ncbi:MAG: hypothetical protein CMM92_02730 [Rickettsiales bacterium]|nr:hypothetical protein [Rickettsiales bacterium]RPG14877.1 MAG: hypothetical protein CBD55_002715 [Pelagibacteraceae bacterium TMED195]|tara:strand:- start:1018 stop:1236 length:219 start_codon:yes stop_codon:yes gene_type:complete
MNKENTRLVWKIIQTHGDLLKDKLEHHPFHPQGRNPYAHICVLIKDNFQESYKDISDEKLDELIGFIKNIKE